jgi:hypothetical protein
MCNRRALLHALLVASTHHVRGGFDFGTGCEGGSGQLTLKLLEGETADVGVLPAGKWNIEVRLTAASDVDVQLFDLDTETNNQNGKTFPGEGAAVVAWCAEPKTCNIGTLGSDETDGCITYKGMRVCYSGYGGVDGNPGKEFITVTGELSTNLKMKAFAFAAGDAVVDYKWARTQTGCCLGILPCVGEFTAEISKGETVEIGAIPRGKKQLSVRLSSGEKDVDIQLWDMSSAAQAACSGGKPIIAYSEGTDVCAKGPLGNNDDGGKESTEYKDLLYEYSGYNGVDGEAGNEYVTVNGIGNLELTMRAYGYAAGKSHVAYSYYEDFSGAGRIEPSVDWRRSLTQRAHKTASYRDVPPDVMLVRRSGTFEFAVNHPEGVNVGDVKVVLEAAAGEAYPASMVTTSMVAQAADRVLVTTALSSSAAVGRYVLRVTVLKDAKTHERSLDLIILFNAYSSTDPAYISSLTQQEEYLESEAILIWQGLSDQNTAHSWMLGQFDYFNLDISLRTLDRMPVADRGDVALVARHITYAVGEDICYGKWGGGSYTTGKPAGGYRCSTSRRCVEPGDWSNTKSLFELHRDVGYKKVQCKMITAVFFVFPAVWPVLI